MSLYHSGGIGGAGLKKSRQEGSSSDRGVSRAPAHQSISASSFAGTEAPCERGSVGTESEGASDIADPGSWAARIAARRAEVHSGSFTREADRRIIASKASNSITPASWETAESERASITGETSGGVALTGPGTVRAVSGSFVIRTSRWSIAALPYNLRLPQNLGGLPHNPRRSS